MYMIAEEKVGLFKQYVISASVLSSVIQKLEL